MKQILCMAAHPDDIAFCIGGAAYLLKDKYRLHVVCATKGERGRPGEGSDETARIRVSEEQAACAMLGADLEFLGKIDRELYADVDTCRQVADIVKAVQPTAILTMWPIDGHPDHSAVGEITSKAVLLAGLDVDVLYYEACLRTQTSQFNPDIYVDITDVMRQKLDLIRCHACQNVDDLLVNDALKQFAFRGYEAGCKYAEGFKTIYPLRADTRCVLDAVGP